MSVLGRKRTLVPACQYLVADHQQICKPGSVKRLQHQFRYRLFDFCGICACPDFSVQPLPSGRYKVSAVAVVGWKPKAL